MSIPLACHCFQACVCWSGIYIYIYQWFAALAVSYHACKYCRHRLHDDSFQNLLECRVETNVPERQTTVVFSADLFWYRQLLTLYVHPDDHFASFVMSLVQDSSASSLTCRPFLCEIGENVFPSSLLPTADHSVLILVPCCFTFLCFVARGHLCHHEHVTMPERCKFQQRVIYAALTPILQSSKPFNASHLYRNDRVFIVFRCRRIPRSTTDLGTRVHRCPQCTWVC